MVLQVFAAGIKRRSKARHAMGKTGVVAAGLVLATCLAGCTPLQFEATDRIPGANATIAALPKYADNLEQVEGRQEWADQKVLQYLNG